MNENPDKKKSSEEEKLIKKAGLEHEEYAGLRKEFYEKSRVIAGLKRFAKRCIEFCRRKGGKCEDVDEMLSDDDKKEHK